MKTKNLFYPGMKRLMTLAILTVTFITTGSAQNSSGRKSFIDNVAVMTSVSGNGFGLHYSPMIGLRMTDRVTISAGPVFRTDRPYFAGYTCHGKFTLMAPEHSFSGRTILYAFTSFEKNRNQYFSKNWIQVEELVSRNEDNKIDFGQVRFSGFEMAGGFAVGHYFTDILSVNMELGISYYKVNKLNYTTVDLYHQPNGVNLHLSLTAKIDL